MEASVRYESLRFDDMENSGDPSPSLRARDVRAASCRALTGGLSWRPATWLRLVGNGILERFGEPRAAPEIGRSGNYLTLSGRFQLSLP